MTCSYKICSTLGTLKYINKFVVQDIKIQTKPYPT